MNRTNSRVRAALCASVALASLVASPAFAQPAATTVDGAAQAEAEPRTDAEIIVTATRRAEALKDVPLAVTALSAAALEKMGAADITDIAAVAPNVTLEVSRGTNSTLSAFIRGVGQQDPVAGFEQGVGIYLDDVYLNRPQAAVLDIYDVERVEVLRGPQGTLYGRNTIGGAVKYVTKRLPDRVAGSGRVTLGSYSQVDLVGSLSAPVGDLVRVGGAVALLTRDGFGENLTTHQPNYNKDVFATRLSAEVGRDERALLRIAADYTHDMSLPRGGHRLIPGLKSGAPVLADVYDSRGGLMDPKQDVWAKGVSAHGQIALSDSLTAKAITSLRKDRSDTPIDFDALPSIDVDVPAIYKNKQFSQELQLAYDQGPLNALVGAYYLNADAFTAFDVRLYNALPTVLPGLTALTEGTVGTKTWALFGDATYDITDQLALTLGGRYTNDKRHTVQARRTYIKGGSPLFGGAAGYGNGMLTATTSSFTGDRTDTAFTPRVSLSFKPTSDHHVYASYSKGFKGGGFDPRGQSASAPDLDGDGKVTAAEVYDYMAFDPEKVTNLEAGWKASLLDRRIYSALALFNMRYNDLQIPGSIGCVIKGVPSFCGATTNAAKARIRGVEWEGDARLFGDAGGNRMNFNWAVGYLQPKFLKYIGAGNLDVADHRKLQNTPKWTASGTLRYATPMADGELSLQSTVSYRGASQQFELASPMLDQGGYALVDAGATWTAPGGRFNLTLTGKNLLDKRYVVSGYNFLAQNYLTGAYTPSKTAPYTPTLGTEGVLTAYYGNPRQVMLTAGVKF